MTIGAIGKKRSLEIHRVTFGWLYLHKFTIMSANFFVEEKFNGITYDDRQLEYKEFEECIFTDCDFRTCSFQSVAFIDCTFFNCNFQDARINYVSLRGVWFNGCNFTSVNFAMTDQVIYEFHFKDCLLDYAKFYALKLKKMQFINCSMLSVDFMSSDLTEALFDNCNLRRAVFSETNLTKADLSTSYDYALDLDKNKVKKAVFSTDGLKGLLEKYQLVIK